MLELDLILQPFVENIYPNLDQADQALYQLLLEEQDTDLFSWFLSREKPEDLNLQRMVQLIRDNTGKNPS